MRYALVVLVAACVFAGGVTDALAGTRSPVPKLAVGPPSGPCNGEHVGDLEIIQGVWFECVCEQRVFTPPTCDWYEITSPAQDPQTLRRWLKRHPKLRAHVHVVSWAPSGRMVAAR